MTRVLRVIARTNVGGPAMQVRSLMTGLAPAEFEQLLVAGAVGPDEHEAMDDRHEPFAVHRIPELGRSVRPRDDLVAARRLAALIRAYRPDVVHTHTAKAGLSGRTLATLLRVPVRVHTFHGHLLHGYYGKWGTWAVTATERTLARVTHELLAVGARVRAELLAAGIGRPDRFAVMPPGIAVPHAVPADAARRRWGVPPGAPTVAIIGRMAPVKRLDRAAEVLHRVSRQRPDLVVLVAGSGTEQATFRAACAGLDVRFLGWQQDVGAIHAASDLSLLTSDNEGMPVSLIEAGMMGRPAVATDVGSVREVVRDGETGIVGPADPQVLADAVIALLQDPERRARMGDAAQRWTLAAFSSRRLVADHEGLYRRLVAAGSLRGAPAGRPGRGQR